MQKIIDFYKSQSIWIHFVIFCLLFLSTYALRHYLFLDDNILLQSSQREIRTEEELEKGYSSLHFMWSFFNIIKLCKLAYGALFIAGFASLFSKFNFKQILKLALFSLYIFSLENLTYMLYYIVFPPDLIKDLGENVFSLEQFFYSDFLRFLFGQFSLFNVLYLVFLAEMVRWLGTKQIKTISIYLIVFAGFFLKILLSYFIF